jgi:hypothetical protein
MTTKSKSEVGHAKNVANLEDLIARCIGYGAPYNPLRAELQIGSLQHLHREAQAALRALAEREVQEQNALNQRAAAFKALRPLVTRVINTMLACGLSDKTIEDARAIQRRIIGSRARKKTNGNDIVTEETPTQATAPEATETSMVTTPKIISASRQSYDLLVEHFSKLVLLLQRETNYLFNEPDLNLSGLHAHEQLLRSLLTAATTAEAETETARNRRTEVLYHPTTGLVMRAKQVKSYVKAVFGVKSSQYRQISKLSFRSMPQK